MNIPISEVITTHQDEEVEKENTFIFIWYHTCMFLPFLSIIVWLHRSTMQLRRTALTFPGKGIVLFWFSAYFVCFCRYRSNLAREWRKFYYSTTTIKDFDYGGKPTWNVCLMIHALKCRIFTPLYRLLRSIFAQKQSWTFWQKCNTKNSKIVN